MAADEDNRDAGETADAKPGEQRQRKRAPVTIDLKAEDVRPEPPAPKSAPVAGTATGTAAEPGKTEPAKPEPAPAANPKTEAPKNAAPRPAEPVRPASPERPASAVPPSSPAQPTPRAAATAANLDDLTRRTVVAGVAGGVVALILAIILQSVGVLPAPGRSAANEAAEQARAAAEATSAIERRLTATEAMVEGLPALRSGLADADAELTALKSSIGTLAERSEVEGVVALVGQLRQRLDALPPAAGSADLNALAERVARLEVSAAAGSDGSPASDAAIATLTDKLTATETALSALTARLATAEAEVARLNSEPMAGGEAAVRAIAITALRRASERGEPFSGEVDMIAAMGVPAADVAALRPYADRGVPTAEAVAAAFPSVADAVLSATATSDPNANIFQRFVSGLGGLVSIRPAGPIPGDDPPAIVSRMVAAVAAGDLATALSERETLPEAGKSASAAWAADASDRVALDALVERIARALGDVGSG